MRRSPLTPDVRRLPEMKSLTLSRRLAYLAAAGVCLSLASHISSLFGHTGPLGPFAFVLHIGVFAVMFPAMLLGRRLTGQRDTSRGAGLASWSRLFSGCPAFARILLVAFAVYALINFFSLLPVPHPPPHEGFNPMSPADVRLFSGHWIVLYSVAFCILRSYSRFIVTPPVFQCTNGHSFAATKESCPQCGSPAQPTRAAPPKFNAV